MLHWSIEEKRLDLIYNWKISRNESSFKDNFFVSVSDDHVTGTGETAPNIRYGETPENIKKEFKDFLNLQPQKVQDLNELVELLKEINLSNSLRFGIESAFIHWYSTKNNISLVNFLNIPPVKEIQTSYTIPIMSAQEVAAFIQKHHLSRFKSLKIKIGTEELELIKAVAEVYAGPLRIDANEAWKDPDQLLVFLNKLKHLNIEFIEQPFPGTSLEEYKYLKKKSPYPVFGDESVTSQNDMEELAQQFHGINMKLMKAGGYLNGIRILNEAKKLGLQTMIGCMVETTLGIRSGMYLCGLADYADLDGSFVIGNEPFDLMKEQDGMLSFK